MNTGKMAWEVATLAIIAVMAMNWSVQQGAEAQVSCLHMDGWGAPLDDANSFVQYWRQTTALFCANATAPAGICWYLDGRAFGWNAMGLMCAPPGTCVTTLEFGNYLNDILAECNQPSNIVQGHNHVSSDVGDMDFWLSNMDCKETSDCSEEVVVIY